MAKYEKELMEAVLKYVRSKGGRYSEWYFGIAKDPKKTLFEEKKLTGKKTSGILILRQTTITRKQRRKNF